MDLLDDTAFVDKIRWVVLLCGGVGRHFDSPAPPLGIPPRLIMITLNMKPKEGLSLHHRIIGGLILRKWFNIHNKGPRLRTANSRNHIHHIPLTQNDNRPDHRTRRKQHNGVAHCPEYYTRDEVNVQSEDPPMSRVV